MLSLRKYRRNAYRDINNQELKTLIGSAFTPEAAMKLVRLGANPNTLGTNGESFLHILVRSNALCNHPSVDRYIIELVNGNTSDDAEVNDIQADDIKADVNVKNVSGLTPLQSLISGNFNPEAAMRLVCLGANPNVVSTHGESLLHIVVKSNAAGSRPSVSRCISELVNKHKADINIKNASGLTPLENLVNGKFTFEAVMALVRLGADANTTDRCGESILHELVEYNCYSNHPSIARYISELVNTYKADIDIKNASGLTPLQSLINGKFTFDAAMALVRLGANPNVRDRKGQSLLDKYGMSMVMEELKKYIEKYNNPTNVTLPSPVPTIKVDVPTVYNIVPSVGLFAAVKEEQKIEKEEEVKLPTPPAKNNTNNHDAMSQTQQQQPLLSFHADG